MSKKIMVGVCFALIIPVLIFSQTFLVNKNKPIETSPAKVAATVPTITPTSAQDDDPYSAVSRICQLVEKNEVSVLEDWVTEVPEIYIQLSREEMRKYLNMDQKEFAEVTKKRNDKLTVPAYPVSKTKTELVRNALSVMDTIQKYKEKFVEIVELKQNENQAKATVSFENDKLGVINYEILLIKVDEKWKVFMFTHPEDWSKTYAEKKTNN